MKTKFTALLFFAIAAVGLQTAHAAPITLYNTGVNAAGVVLADGSVGDPHYTLVSVPGSSAAVRIISAASGYPILSGVWMGDSATSRWIGPNNNADLDGPAGAYVYRTTFDLTGYDATSASIQGLWSTDNEGLDILINGVGLGYSTPGGQFAAGFAAFTVSSGFVAGINTLDFVVNNGGGPTGLRAELTGSAALTQALPEPASLALVALALAGLGGSRRLAHRKAVRT